MRRPRNTRKWEDVTELLIERFCARLVGRIGENERKQIEQREQAVAVAHALTAVGVGAWVATRQVKKGSVVRMQVSVKNAEKIARALKGKP